MRTREGVGRVPPRPVPVTLSDEDHALARWAARELMTHRHYEQRSDQWGHGRFGPLRTCLVGMVGQMAFAKWVQATLGIKVPIDTKYRPCGDGGVDFVVCRYRVQVKTAESPYDELLVRTTEVGGPADDPIPWDVCFRLQWGSSSAERGPRLPFGDGPRRNRDVVQIRGVVWSADFWNVSGLPVPARGGGSWHNFEIGPANLLPASTFIDKCKARLTRDDRDAS